MKRANMVLDFKNDKASILNKEINLNTTASGHYTISLTKPTQLICNLDSNHDHIVLIAKTNKTSEEIAHKLHRQFAHPRTEQLLNLIKRAGHPWCDDVELQENIKKISKECETCQVYQKPPP